MDEIDSDELQKSLLIGENGHLTELMKAAEDPEPTAPTPQPATIIYEEFVECPSCLKQIPADATKCQHCGVEFEMEEMFECPMCSTLLEITVTKCPSCGAEFEEEAPQPPPPVEEAPPQPIPAPVPEKKPEPTSFADRLKQMKEEPSSERMPDKASDVPSIPKRELSFAERMKAMKDGTIPEETRKPAPAQSQTPPITPAVAPQSPVTHQAAPVIQKIPQSSAPSQSVTPQSPVTHQAAPVPQKTPQPTPSTTATVQPSTTGTSLSDRIKSLKQDAPAATSQPTHKPEPAGDNIKDLPRHIGEVKKLLILANELKVDVSTSKAVINRAVTAGKSRDLENAIKLVKEGKAGIEKELKSVYLSRIRTLDSALALEQKSGKDVSALLASVDEARKSIEACDFDIASGILKNIESHMMSTSSSTLSEAELDVISSALGNADYLKLDIGEARSFFEEAKKAAAQNDNQRSLQFTKQASGSLDKMLPSYIAGEMRKAKITLREIKMMNVDISAPVQMLKEANDHVAHGDYCSALQHIKSFREYVEKASQ